MNSEVLSSAVLFGHLAVISWIDFHRFAIPNYLNLSLALCGLAASALMSEAALTRIVVDGAMTFLAFQLLALIYFHFRKRSGLGGGDIKFLAAAAMWVGAFGIPWVVLFGSISGLLFVLGATIAGRQFRAESRLAFGPHLSLGLIVVWGLRDVLAG